jgi:hypothetical protein
MLVSIFNTLFCSDLKKSVVNICFKLMLKLIPTECMLAKTRFLKGISILFQLMIFEPKASTSPDTFYPWFVAIIVGCLGVGQQFCLIGELIIILSLSYKMLIPFFILAFILYFVKNLNLVFQSRNFKILDFLIEAT